MKKIIQTTVWSAIFLAVFANIFLFLSGLNMGNQIGTFEKSIADLKQENIELEQKVYQAQSYTSAASIAAALSYTKQTEPIYIDNLLYAKNF